MNAVLIVSDGLEARIGTLTAEKEWFKAWRTISGDSEADSNLPQLEVLLSGVCEPKRFLSLVRDFIVVEDDGIGNLEKKMAGLSPVLRSRNSCRRNVTCIKTTARHESRACKSTNPQSNNLRRFNREIVESALFGTLKARVRV